MKLYYLALVLPSLFTEIFADVNIIDTVDPASVSCDDEYLNDANSLGADRWTAAGAEIAFKLATANWTLDEASDDPSRLSFSEYIANLYNARDLMVCENMGDGPCQTTMLCSDASQPAAYLILNSFVAIHVLQNNIYSGLQDAMNEIQNKMTTFQEVFSPAAEPKSNGWLMDLLSVTQFVVGLGSAFAWNIAFKSASIAANPNTYGFYQESTNGALALGFSIGKSHIPAASDLQNDLTTTMGLIFESWIDSQFDFLHELFSGSSDGMLTLGSLMQDGLALDMTRDLDLEDMSNEAQKLIFSQMLPLAWDQSTVEINDIPSEKMYPMILMVPDDCVTSGDNLNWVVDEDKSDQMSVCYDGHTFFVGFPTFTGLSSDDNPERLRLWALPGGENDELDGSKWGGLTLEDLVISAFEGYKLNGYKNGYTAPSFDGTTEQATIMMEKGVRTPGFISLPICTEGRLYTEAKDYPRTHFHQIIGEDIPTTYPCGTGYLTSDEMEAFGFS
ncbi:hypothetical protein EDB80DRAFT_897412 [Ilyonectria destructans]|nr:hypothetical protein EDB80DRAFT_897412 [Ilyonectria destructans]